MLQRYIIGIKMIGIDTKLNDLPEEIEGVIVIRGPRRHNEIGVNPISDVISNKVPVEIFNNTDNFLPTFKSVKDVNVFIDKIRDKTYSRDTLKYLSKYNLPKSSVKYFALKLYSSKCPVKTTDFFANEGYFGIHVPLYRFNKKN